MIKKCVCILLLLLTLTVPVLAADSESQNVVDYAQLLDWKESEELKTVLDGVSQRLQMDVVVVTVPSLGGKSVMAYADDYYDYNGYSPDGVLLLVAASEREWWISTRGRAIRALTDRELDILSSWFLDSLSRADYAEAFRIFAEGFEELAAEDVRKQGISPAAVLICLCIGAAGGFIVTGILKGQLKTVRRQNSAGSYVVPGSMDLNFRADRFLYRNVSRRVKPKNNGSSTHRSSSGHSHGGGGGRF